MQRFGTSLLAAGALLASESQACMQLTLWTVTNSNGIITDFQSPEDELYGLFGIGEDFLVSWKDSIVPNEVKQFGFNMMTLPCFSDEVFWIQLEETDQTIPDMAQISLHCKHLVPGFNDIIINLQEDVSGLSI